jgi:hypothetical protein
MKVNLYIFIIYYIMEIKRNKNIINRNLNNLVKFLKD